MQGTGEDMLKEKELEFRRRLTDEKVDFIIIGMLLLAAAWAGCSGTGGPEPGTAPGPTPQGFLAGFARVDISPDHPVKMAGYGTYFLDEDLCRWSTGVHDPLYASAAAFQDPDARPVILIQLDVIGALTTDVVRIQAGVASAIAVPEENVIVAASHSHGSPDTVGIWGLILPPVTGRDPEFIEAMVEGAVEAGVRAWESRVPASLRAASGAEPRMHFNPQLSVDPAAVTDDTMTLLAAADAQGRPLGTLMSWGCHPMVMGPQNTLISADYPGAYCRIMDRKLGGLNLYLNSSLGATVHPQNPDHPFPIEGNRWGTWDDVERFGRVLADDALELAARAEPLSSHRVRLVSRPVYGRLENPFFSLAGELGIIPREMPPVGETGETYDLTVVLGNAYSSDKGAVYFDWNQNYVFDAVERIDIGTGYGPYVATVTVPEDAVVGQTRMRVRMSYSVDPAPCGVLSYGEVEDYTINVQPLTVTNTIDPNPLLAVMAYLATPKDAIVYVGGEFAPGYTVHDLDMATVTVNGIANTSYEVIDNHPEIDGDVMAVHVPLDQLVLSYGLLWDGMSTTYAVAGSMTDLTTFTLEGEVEYFGHSSGDLNSDMSINVADVTYFTNYLFSGGPAPHVLAVADVNANGNVNVSDLSYFTKYLFAHGPAPVHP